MRIVFACVLALLLSGCLKHELQTGLNEHEAQEIIVLLKRNGLDATRQMVANGKESATWTVEVLGGNQNLVLAWRVLQENGLPRQKVKGLGEVFGASGLIPTAGEEKAKALVGLTGEITRTLNSVDGVVDARVHVVLPDNSPLVDRSQWNPTTASVLIKHRGVKLPLEETEVKTLVAKSVQGLTPEQVAVVYKSVPVMKNPPQDVEFFLGNQQLTLISVALMSVLAVVALFLSFRVRQLKGRLAKQAGA
jgi:type III secretion protein J